VGKRLRKFYLLICTVYHKELEAYVVIRRA
jgi:hypothetical protein